MIRINYLLPIQRFLGLRLVLAVAFIGGLGLLYSITPNTKPAAQPAQVLPATTIVPLKPFHGQPVRLIIPTLSVNANVIHVGLTPDGDMDAPAKLADAGWFKYGSHPGDEGSAVIAGHVGGTSNPGIFINLNKLQRGDRISVIDDKGQTTSFTVRELRTYNREGRPEEVFRGKGGAYLNLITCAGRWQEGHKTFSERLVVFAEQSE